MTRPGDEPDVVHLWTVRLECEERVVEGLRALLAADEQERAQRFHFEADRRRYTVARGALRQVLGDCLEIDPGRVAFTYGSAGKPSVAAPGSDISFNVSHSHELALIAVSRGRELGVDVEQVRPAAFDQALAERMFAASEAHTIRSQPPPLQAEAFFACWTRKEAYIKARGEGLSFELNRFEVSVAPGEPAALLCVQDEPAEPARWAMMDLRPAPGYIGALVGDRGPWQLRVHAWPAW